MRRVHVRELSGVPRVQSATTREEVLENGRLYVRTVLSDEFLRKCHQIQLERIRDDWWEALKFYLSRVLYQGRQDTVSAKVERAVREAFRDSFRERGRESSPSDLMKPLERALRSKLGKGKVGKGADILLVKGTMELLVEVEDWNIVNYAIKLMKSGLVHCLRCRLEEIVGIGPKTSRLFLRDVFLLYSDELRDSLKRPRDWESLQPIDTWVRKVVNALKIVDYPEEKPIAGEKWDREVRKRIVSEFGEDSPLFNAGAWYTGYTKLGGKKLPSSSCDRE